MPLTKDLQSLFDRVNSVTQDAGKVNLTGAGTVFTVQNFDAGEDAAAEGVVKKLQFKDSLGNLVAWIDSTGTLSFKKVIAQQEVEQLLQTVGVENVLTGDLQVDADTILAGGVSATVKPKVLVKGWSGAAQFDLLKIDTSLPVPIVVADHADFASGKELTQNGVLPVFTHVANATIHVTANEKGALAGTAGTPSGTNKYVTNDDARNTNTRTPVAHKTSHELGGSDAISVAGLSGVLGDLQNPKLNQDTLANRPVASIDGRLFRTTDESIIYRDSGALWTKVAVTDYADLEGVPASFTPSAHAGTHLLGGTDQIDIANLPGRLAEAQFLSFQQNAVAQGLAFTLNVTGSATLTVASNTATLNVTPGSVPLATEVTHGLSRLSIAAGSASDPIVLGENDLRVPTLDQKQAMAGTNGAPGDLNRYVTNTDPRNINARTPTAHKLTHQQGGTDALDLTGLVGLLATAQTPIAHAASHAAAGSDPLSHANLGGLSNDDHLQYPKADGTRGFSGPVPGQTPTGPTHLVPRSYIDGIASTPVADIIELAAVDTTATPDRQVRLVEEEGTFFRFDLQATSGGIAPTTGPGRWLKISGGVVDHEALSGLLGGAAGEHYHLNSGQHADLTDGGESTLHKHAFDRDRANHTGTQSRSTISDFAHASTHSFGGTDPITHANLAGLGADDHPHYSRADGTRAFTGVVVGVDPTGDSHLTTKGFTATAIATAVAVVSGKYAPPVQTLTVLANVAPADRQDKQVRLVEDAGSFYRFDADAVSGDVAPTSGTGFWFQNSARPQSHQALTDLQGGSAGERYHLTQAQHGGLTAGSGTTLHTHAHANLTGLAADDHPHYMLADGTRAFTSPVTGVNPTTDQHLATKIFVVNTVNAYLPSHQNLQDLQGGSLTERYHLTSAQQSGLTGGAATALHTHSHANLTNLSADDHAQYLLASGTRALTGPLSSPAPTAGSHLTNRDYVDQKISVVAGFHADAVADVAALQAVAPADRVDRQLRLVESVGAIYRFDAQAVTGEVVPDVGTGRWFKTTSSTQDHNSLTTLQGGSANERYHLTVAEHSGLTGSGSTALHTHDHGALGGLGDDDHTIYSKADGTRAFTGVVVGTYPTLVTHLATLQAVRDEVALATIEVLDQGASEGQVGEVDFAGAGVSVAIVGGRATVTIPGGAGGASLVVKKDGVAISSAAAIDLIGCFDVTEAPSGEANVTIPITTDVRHGLFSSTQKLKLDTIEPGAEVNNISDANASELTGGGTTTLHQHNNDRNRANHTGTQSRSTISDFAHSSDHEQGAADPIPSLPTTGQKSALAGTSGAPSNTNRYVTDADTRLTDTRPPASHAATHQDGGTDKINVGNLDGRLKEHQFLLFKGGALPVGGELAHTLTVVGGSIVVNTTTKVATLTVDSSAFTKAKLDTLGVTELSVDPADLSKPIALGANDGRVPTQAENDAFQQIVGQTVPSGTNRFVADQDTRIPLQAENDALGVIPGQATPSNANRFVTSQDTRLPSQNENDALAGTSGVPGSGNPYVTNSDARIHAQNTDTGTNVNTFSIGDGLAGTKTILFNNADVNKPGYRYNDTTNKCEFSNNGSVWQEVGTIVGGAATNAIDTLIPEYPGAVIFFDGVNNEAGALGLTSGFDSTAFHNFYEWSSDATGTNDVSIVIRYRLPSNFLSWNDLQLFNQVIQSIGNVAKVELRMWGTDNNEVTLTGGNNLQNVSWTESVITVGAGAFTPGGYVTLRVTLYAGQNDRARVGEIFLDFNRS